MMFTRARDAVDSMLTVPQIAPGVWAWCQPWTLKGEQSGSQARIATASVSLRVRI